jgi:hypothetical protein
MVAPLIKALGAVVVGTPVAVVLGLTARSIRKQEDASVPVIRKDDAPLRVTLFSSYLDKRSHEYLSPKSMKKGYVAYDFVIVNPTRKSVHGIHVELLDADGVPISTVRLGEVEAHGRAVIRAKKSWASALQAQRALDEAAPRVVLTWRSAAGRRRAIVPVRPVRALGENPGIARARRRSRPEVLQPVMS